MITGETNAATCASAASRDEEHDRSPKRGKRTLSLRALLPGPYVRHPDDG